MPLWWTLGRLKSSDAKARRAAAEKLAGVRDPKSTQALLTAALNDGDWHVRAAAAKSLGAHCSIDALSCLVQLLAHRSRDVRSRALDALVNSGAGAVVALIPALNSDDDQQVVLALEALGRIGHPFSVEPIAAFARRPNRHREARAWGDDLYSFTGAAIRALRDIGGEKAVEQLLRLQAEGVGSPHAIRQALDKVDPAWRKSEAAVEAMPAILSQAGTGGATDLLGEIGDRRAVEPLVEQLANPQQAEAALRSLDKIEPAWPVRLQARALVPRLIANLGKEPRARRTAAEILGRIKDKSAVPALINAMTSNSGRVSGDSQSTDDVARAQAAAAAALAEIGDPQAVPALVNVFVDDRGPSEMAKRSLDRLYPAWPKTVPDRLVARFKKDKSFLRLLEPSAIQPLLPLLLPMLAEANLRWRLAAAWAVARCLGSNSARHLEPMRSDPEFVVRWTAAHLLDSIRAAPLPAEYRQPISECQAFCFRCGAALSANIPHFGVEADCFMDVEEVRNAVPFGGAVCGGCGRIWCLECATPGELCPGCQGRLDEARVGNTYASRLHFAITPV